MSKKTLPSNACKPEVEILVIGVTVDIIAASLQLDFCLTALAVAAHGGEKQCFTGWGGVTPTCPLNKAALFKGQVGVTAFLALSISIFMS